MIVQIGPYPPPHGGISVYVKRLKAVLDEKNIENEVWSVYGNSKEVKRIKLKFIFINIIKNKDISILHYNIAGIKGKAYIFFINKIFTGKKKKVITLHGDSKDLFIKNKNFMKKILNSFDYIICVKKDDTKYLKEMGITTKSIEIPAYLNPLKDDDDYKKINSEVRKFIDESEFLISSNGAITFYNGEDLYGLDMLIELMKIIKDKYNEVNLLFCVLSKEYQSKEESDYYKKLKSKISEYNLEERMMLYEVNNTEFYPILERSKIFIRPTNTDGDAVSIREALYLKTVTVASDIVERANGVVLFKNRDFNDMYSIVKNIIENYDKFSAENDRTQLESNSEKILAVYSELLGEI